MRAMGTAGLVVSIAVLAGCTERSAMTAPWTSPAVLSAAGFIGDRPYTWRMKCSGEDKIYGPAASTASWSWTAAGASIAGTEMSITCWPNTSPISGTGTRPASADGFSACVNKTCQTWTFDAAGVFKAQLNGSYWIYFLTCPVFKPGRTGWCKVDVSATLNID